MLATKWKERSFLEVVDILDTASLSGEPVQKIDEEPPDSKLWEFAHYGGETYQLGNGDKLYICSDVLFIEDGGMGPALFFIGEKYEEKEAVGLV
jgi:hypothetical protein